jgi:arylsulfatase A-like enzyme
MERAMERQNRRDFLKRTALGAAGAFGAAAGLSPLSVSGAEPEAPGRSAAKRPNILFLFADDLRWSAVHALGGEAVRTPHLDALGRDGVVFERPYIMGSTVGAVCVCSRAMLMTGRPLWHVRSNLRPELALLPRTFQQAGYANFGIGKWHNGPASFNRAFENGAAIFFGGMNDHLALAVADYSREGKYGEEARHPAGKFSSELFSDEAIGFLRRHDGRQPFFLYVAYMAPHDPRMAPKPFADLYAPDSIELPKNFLPEHPFDNGEMKVRDEELAPWPRTPEVVRRHIADYYAMITHLDEQIGRVLQALKESGQAENTIIVFAGDNGLAVGQHGLFGKQNLYEHSVRVPLLISGPGLPKGERRAVLCYLHDLFPTLCDLAGVPKPETVESVSLAPALKSSDARARETIFAAYRNVQRMVRDDRLKLIEYYPHDKVGTRKTQLFDVANDPWEMKNLADDPQFGEPLARLRAILGEAQRKNDDPLLKKA